MYSEFQIYFSISPYVLNHNHTSENTKDELSGGFPAGVITAGQLLCGGLFSNDRLSNWFSAVALAHGLMDQEEIKVIRRKVTGLYGFIQNEWIFRG